MAKQQNGLLVQLASTIIYSAASSLLVLVGHNKLFNQLLAGIQFVTNIFCLITSAQKKQTPRR